MEVVWPAHARTKQSDRSESFMAGSSLTLSTPCPDPHRSRSSDRSHGLGERCEIPEKESGIPYYDKVRLASTGETSTQAPLYAGTSTA